MHLIRTCVMHPLDDSPGNIFIEEVGKGSDLVLHIHCIDQEENSMGMNQVRLHKGTGLEYNAPIFNFSSCLIDLPTFLDPIDPGIIDWAHSFGSDSQERVSRLEKLGLPLSTITRLDAIINGLQLGTITTPLQMIYSTDTIGGRALEVLQDIGYSFGTVSRHGFECSKVSLEFLIEVSKIHLRDTTLDSLLLSERVDRLQQLENDIAMEKELLLKSEYDGHSDSTSVFDIPRRNNPIENCSRSMRIMIAFFEREYGISMNYYFNMMSQLQSAKSSEEVTEMFDMFKGDMLADCFRKSPAMFDFIKRYMCGVV